MSAPPHLSRNARGGTQLCGTFGRIVTSLRRREWSSAARVTGQSALRVDLSPLTRRAHARRPLPQEGRWGVVDPPFRPMRWHCPRWLHPRVGGADAWAYLSPLRSKASRERFQLCKDHADMRGYTCGLGFRDRSFDGDPGDGWFVMSHCCAPQFRREHTALSAADAWGIHVGDGTQRLGGKFVRNRTNLLCHPW